MGDVFLLPAQQLKREGMLQYVLLGEDQQREAVSIVT